MNSKSLRRRALLVSLLCPIALSACASRSEITLVQTLPAPAAPQVNAKPELTQEELEHLITNQIPKEEMRVLEFLRANPDWDGRGVVVAVYDTGVDPGAANLQTTSDGQRKIVDIIDASGSGDVDMTTTATLANGTLPGLSGRSLLMPEVAANRDGYFRVGLKRADELFDGQTMSRVREERRRRWESRMAEERAVRERQTQAMIDAGTLPPADKDDADITLEQRELRLREKLLRELEDKHADSDIGMLLDCVLWHDGSHWYALVDTDSDGDLRDEKALRPYGVAGEYGRFSDEISSNFNVQVYDEGRTLSIVTVNGAHGTHVAGIIAAHDPLDARYNGIAPGARILSVRLADGRQGGGSNLIGETRAVIATAKAKADLMNASWGGASVFQDGTDLGCQLYTRLVRDYGIAAFVSAGNNGPGLSTLGGPGGECPSVIGVGAHVSATMTEALHSLHERTGDTPYNFTSRGPAKSGDLGVDITAPGGAISPVSNTTLSRTMLMNGTSMSSPAAAGVGAILLSAARAEGVPVSPARLRTALMNGARYMDDVEPFAQGAGMVDVPGAWQALKAQGRDIAWDAFFDITSTANDLRSGQGIYLRTPPGPGVYEAPISVRASFPESTPNATRTAMQTEVVLTTTAPWISAPRYLSMTNISRSIRAALAIGKTSTTTGSPAISFGQILGYAANNRSAGPLFRIPATVIHPTRLGAEDRFSEPFETTLKPGQTHRRFYVAPPGATRVRVRFERPVEETGTRSIEVVVQSLASDLSFNDTSGGRTERLEPGAVFEGVFPVLPDRTVEVALSQAFASPGETNLVGRVSFLGVDAEQAEVLIEGGKRHGVARVRSDLHTTTVEATAKLTNAITTLRPKDADIRLLGERDVFPAVRDARPEQRQSELVLRYEIEVEEPVTVRFAQSVNHEALMEEVASGLVQVHHESGLRVFFGSPSRWAQPRLPKGKNTILRHFRATDTAVLEALKREPLRLSVELERPAELRVTASPTQAARGAAPSGPITLDRLRTVPLFIAAPERAPESKLTASAFTGTLELKAGDDTLLALPITMMRGERERPSGEDSDSDTKVDPVEKFDTDRADALVSAIRRLRFKTEAEGHTSHTLLLERLRRDHPTDTRADIEEAIAVAFRDGRLSPWMGEPEREEEDVMKLETLDLGLVAVREESTTVTRVMDLIDRTLLANNPDAVAAYFGARPVPKEGDKEASRAADRESRRMSQRRTTIRTAHLLRAEVLRSLGRTEDARAALQQAYSWEADAKKPSDETQHQEIAQLLAEQRWATALEKFHTLTLSKSPYDRVARLRRIAIWERLGWTYWIERERQDLKTVKARSPKWF